MSRALTIAGKEFRTFFKTPVAPIVLFAFLLLAGLLFFFVPDYFAQGQASMRGFFAYLPWLYLIFAPAIAMKMWAEERKVGTIETLLTMPLGEGTIVLGKFLAAFGLLALALALTFPVPIIVALTAASAVDPGPIAGGYLGALLLGAAYVAMCLFASALTQSQVVAFIIGVGLCLLFVVIGVEPVANVFPQGLGELLKGLSLLQRFANIQRGVVDTRDVLYYLSMLAVFLLLNAAAVKRR
ncbi:MAG: ABC transporter permease subunit [Planctomycetes bacterium]|nr:ABC transporter permease subunit [Planctomycetota bacterium]